MSKDPRLVQLDLFDEDTPAYQEALARYDLLQPILTNQRRILDAYVQGCTYREALYRQHEQVVRDYQFGDIGLTSPFL